MKVTNLQIYEWNLIFNADFMPIHQLIHSGWFIPVSQGNDKGPLEDLLMKYKLTNCKTQSILP